MSTTSPSTTLVVESPASTAQALDPRDLIAQLRQLCRLPTSELDWNRYAALMRQLCKASHAAVIRQVPASADFEQVGRATELATWSPLQALPAGVDLLAKASANGYAHAPAQAPDGQTWLVLVLALQGLPSWFLVLNIKMQERGQINELTLRAMLCADFDHAGSRSPALSSAPVELTRMLDLATEVMQRPHFDSACLALVNGIATEWRLVQASMGWVVDSGFKLAAISHLDRFERNSRQTHRLEKALEPALVYGHEVWFPGSDDAMADITPLADLADELQAERAVVIPVRDEQGRVQAVLFLAFSADSQPVTDLTPLLLALEMMQPRLSDLWLRALGVRQRSVRYLNHSSTRVFGPEHGLLKLAGVLAVCLLLYAAFGSWTYRVDANAQLSTESTRLISAQFDGRIDQVHTTAGELVKAGALLLTLDTRELEQQRAELMAETSKAEAETNRHRADGRLAEMEIGQARLDQSFAKLKRIEYYLQQSESRAPFEGVIVEGERKDLLGAPVRKGDRIFRIAKTEGLYATLMVPERQMRHIAAGASGEVSLLSHPDHSIPIRVSSVIPVAQVKGQEGNQFMITAELLQSPQPWWRPGMTGLARIDAGDKNIAWILTHRVIDHLRLLLWW